MRNPSPDDRCGRHFQFRQFFEAGETWKQTSQERPFTNYPVQLATYDAISTLCEKVLIHFMNTLALSTAFPR